MLSCPFPVTLGRRIVGTHPDTGRDGIDHCSGHTAPKNP